MIEKMANGGIAKRKIFVARTAKEQSSAIEKENEVKDL